MNDEFDYDSLEVIDVPVKYGGKKYVLREASGDTGRKFNDARTKCMHFQDGGVSGVEGVGGLPIYLLSMCLFETDEDGVVQPKRHVTQEALKSWPERVIQPLFMKAREIGELDQDSLESLRKQYKELGERIAKMEEDAVKNEPKSTETGFSLPGKEV